MVAVLWSSTIQACIVTSVHIFIFIFGLVCILHDLPSVPCVFWLGVYVLLVICQYRTHQEKKSSDVSLGMSFVF